MRKLLILPLLLLPCLARAMWDTQTISLKTGYNAVVLRVTPADTRCSEVFKGCDITNVTWWNRDRRDDGSGIVPTADTLIWSPTDEAGSTFFRVLGGHTYIIRSKKAQTLTIVGVPARARTMLWLNEVNLVGLNLPDDPQGGEVGFYDYYTGMLSCLKGESIAVVNASSADPVLWNASSYIRSPNEAVWLKPYGAGTLEYMGPLWVDVDTADNAIRFLSNTETRRITVKNVSEIERRVNISLRPSATPPYGQGTLLGDAKLMREEIDWTAGYPRRVFKENNMNIVTNLAAGESFEIAIRPDLDKMPAAEDGAYMSVLEINDVGTVIQGNTMANGVCRHRIGISCDANLASRKNPTGLWVGTAVIYGVNRVAQISDAVNTWDPETIEPANQTFEFRLIVHVDEGGTARLLKEVYVATESDPDAEPTLLISRYEAINWRNSHPNGRIRRISSANFPNFGNPIEFTGTGFAHGGTISAFVPQAYDDKVNPYIHAYHPQHDNVVFENKHMIKYSAEDGSDGTGDFESWAVNRTVSLEFANADPVGGGNYDWNRTVTGGTYRENIESLVKTTIHAVGTFRLSKILDTHILTGLE